MYIYKLCIYTHKAYLIRADLGFKNDKKSHFAKPLCDFSLDDCTFLNVCRGKCFSFAPHISEKQPTESFESISSNLNLLRIISLSAHVYAAIA